MKKPIVRLLPLLILLPIAALAQPAASPEPTLIGAGGHWGPLHDGSKSDRFTPIPIVTGLVTREPRRLEGNGSRSRLVDRPTSAYVTTGITYRF